MIDSKSADISDKDETGHKEKKEQRLYRYLVQYSHQDGTIEEFEIDTERDLDIEKDMSFLDNVIDQFRQHSKESEQSEIQGEDL